MMKIMRILRNRFGDRQGFTMIEIIAVLVILGIIMVVIMARGSASEDARLQAEVDTLVGHLRYAQYLAINDISPVKWGIQVSGQSYTLVRDINGDGTVIDNPYNLPGESSATHNFAPINATGTGTVLFNEWGSPNTPIPAIALGGKSITITAGTGFIP